MQVDILQRAREIRNTLATYSKYDKSENELRALQNGRGSLTLELLELDHHKITKALNVAERERDDLYMKLTYLVNSEDE